MPITTIPEATELRRALKGLMVCLKARGADTAATTIAKALALIEQLPISGDSKELAPGMPLYNCPRAGNHKGEIEMQFVQCDFRLGKEKPSIRLDKWSWYSSPEKAIAAAEKGA